MKKNIPKTIITGFIMAGCFLITVNAFSQYKKLPDGSIVYSDGTRRLPNGTVIYKDGNNNGNNNGRIIRLPDGRVVYPDGSRRYPNDRRNRRNNRDYDNRGWFPPGQAKKIYGGNAKEYAHGQQRKWKENDHENDHENDEHHDD